MNGGILVVPQGREVEVELIRRCTYSCNGASNNEFTTAKLLIELD